MDGRVKPDNIVSGLMIGAWFAGWFGLVAYHFAEPKMLIEPVIFPVYDCPSDPQSTNPFDGIFCDTWEGIPGLDPNWKGAKGVMMDEPEPDEADRPRPEEP